jgi:hypothetical protein
MRQYLYRDQNKLSINADKFISCETKYHAYLLGFMWADGYLLYEKKRKEMRVEIVDEDMSDIKNVFDATGKWYFITRHRKNRKPQTTASGNNAKLCDYLHENDYNEKSTSSPTKIIKCVPKNFIKYFLRGWSDGDGCFYTNGRTRHFSICGSYEQDWSILENIFKDNGIDYKIQRRTHKTGKFSVIRVWNKNSLLNISKILYQDYDGIGLKRKYDKCQEITNQLSK